MSFIERLNLLCPLFGVSFKRGSTVHNTCHISCTLRPCLYSSIFDLKNLNAFSSIVYMQTVKSECVCKTHFKVNMP